MTRPPLGDPAMLLASAGGIGLLPTAPGTWGSLLGVVLAWLVADPLPLLAVCAALFIAGWFAADRVAMRSGVADPGFVVIDEVVGQALVLATAPHSLWAYATGFVLFRIADILKPWPIRFLEAKFLNGFGVMLDDVAAAVYAAAVLHLGLKIYLETAHAA